MNYGFLIDNRTCIGCHACSTACKMENEVPLGVYRTWVKSVDKGAFPHAKRSFQVSRCNHCANPPCVRICPVEAMFQRADGIVDFDPSICIGCKACLQACPYDAIYIDPNSHTAAKCHFCAHRVEVGLEPACVIVCPVQAIVAGDLDDPGSRISQMVAQNDVSVRKPEQGTAPKLFYIDGDEVMLTPTAPGLPGTFAWAELATDQAKAIAATTHPALPASWANGHGKSRPAPRIHDTAGVAVRSGTPQAVGGWTGPLHVGSGGGSVAGDLMQTVYNAQHKVPWHWQVPAYLVTKAIGAGVLMVGMYFGLFHLGETVYRPGLAITLTALVFTGLTTLLLVLDLEQPRRFLYILTRPQWKSWLTRGAFILIAYSIYLVIWLALFSGFLPEPLYSSFGVALVFIMLGWMLAVATAVYTAYLFGQAEGRDLWQSSLLPVHLVVQALMAGCAALILLVLSGVTGAEHWVVGGATYVLVGLLVVDLFLIFAGEFAMPHATESAARAAHAIKHGRYKRHFWIGAIAVGHLLPLALTIAGFAYSPLAQLVTGLSVIAGLYFFEYAFVMAPQEVPNS